MKEKDIILFNKKIGIRTVFFKEKNGVLGYSNGYTVYLNKFYRENLYSINKHEILHFYEDSNLFKKVKKIIFDILSVNKLQKLRNLYFDSYKNVYEYNDLLSLIDNEIVIDFISGNIYSELDFSGLYNKIIAKGRISFVSDKKYLNLIVPLKIKQKFKELSEWEKIFVTNYYQMGNIGLPSRSHTKYEDIRDMIKYELSQLYDIAESDLNFFIDVNSKDILREYELELKNLVGNEKEYNNFLRNKENILKKKAKKYSEFLHAEYKNIVETVKNSDYEDAFKYLMLNETLTKVYRQQREKNNNIKILVDKREIEETIRSHMVFSEKVLEVIYKDFDKYSNFSNLYFHALDVFFDSMRKSDEIVFSGLNTFNKGKWIRFEGKKYKPLSYLKNAQNLSAMVAETPWCTKEQATSHLVEGDFYLFVDNDNKPHIGIKLIGNKIDEVRGIKNGNAQEIEEEYRDVVIEFLTKNKNIKFGQEWLDKEIWNDRLAGYIEKIEAGDLGGIDIKQMIYDLTEVIDYKAHYAQCGNRRELLSRIKNADFLRKIIAKKYGCNYKKVFIGDIGLKKETMGEVFPYSIVLGNIDVSRDAHCQYDFRNLKIVFGNFSVADVKVKNLNNLEFVVGSATFSSVDIDKLDKLKFIGEIADFYNSKIGSMKNLKKIVGSANFICSKIGDLSGLETIGEDAYFDSAVIGDLSSLVKIGGNACVNNALLNKLGNVVCEGRVVGFMAKNNSAGYKKSYKR